MPDQPDKLTADLERTIKKHQDALRRDLERRIAKEANHERMTELVESIVRLAASPQAGTTTPKTKPRKRPNRPTKKTA